MAIIDARWEYFNSVFTLHVLSLY